MKSGSDWARQILQPPQSSWPTNTSIGRPDWAYEMPANDGAVAIARPPPIRDRLLNRTVSTVEQFQGSNYARARRRDEAARARPHCLVTSAAASGCRALLGLLDDALRRPSGQLLQVVELGAEGADALGYRADLDDHVGDLRLRHQCRDLVPAVPAGAGVVAEELAAAARDQPLDARRRLAGRRHRHLEDRLEQDRPALGHGLAHGDACRHLERHFRAVDRVELAVEQRDFEIDDRLADRAFLGVVNQPFLDAGNELARPDIPPDLLNPHATPRALHR